MSAIDALYALVERFADSANIALHTERCLNNRFRALDCSLCADACPAEGAITVSDGKPSLDNELCLHCGLCLHNCPTDAFTLRDVLTGKLIQLIDALPAGQVHLLCPQHLQPDQGPDGIAVQTQRCLAALSPVTLLTLSTKSHPIQLDDSPCADCPLVYVHSAIAETTARCNDWIDVLPDTPTIRLRSEQMSETEKIDRRPVFNPTMSPVTRRSLLQSMKKVGEQAAAPPQKAVMIKIGRSVPVSERLPQTLPSQHVRLIAAVEQHAGSESSPVAPAHVDLSVDRSRCTGCTLCARFCPTGALKFIADGAAFDLSLQPALCLGSDCHICELACPEDAICMPSQEMPRSLMNRTSLLTGSLGPCQECGQLIRASQNLPATCFACRPKPGPPDDSLLLDSLWK